jgi:hypothetical protein
MRIIFFRIVQLFITVYIMLLFLSCKEKSTNPQNTEIVFSANSSNCALHGLGKASALDSIFTYSFSSDLLIDFSVWSNCCPDSNRFIINQFSSADTLHVVVTDTARHLCYCICPYIIHAEFQNLPADHYIVRCVLQTPAGIPELFHLVHIYRKN